MVDRCSNAVYGPKMPLENEQFGKLLFQRIDSLPKDKILMVNPESKEQLTAREIQRGSIKLALALSKYVNQGDVIASLCENDNLSIFPIIASLYLGTTISFINPISHARELKLSFDKIKPKVLFCAKKAVRSALELKEQVESIELVVILGDDGDLGGVTLPDFIDSTKISESAIDAFKPVNPKSEDDTAVVLFSSGTSGLPKGALISYKNLKASHLYVIDKRFIGLSASDTILVVVPIFHVFGLLQIIFSVMEGSKLVIVKKFIPNAFLEALASYEVTKIMIVPPLAIFLAMSPLIDNYDLSNLKDIFCGAAPLSQNFIDLLYHRLNVKVRQLYGLTEVSGVVAIVHEVAEDTPLVAPNLEVVIKDIDTRRILTATNQGEICVKGPSVTKGYIQDNQATENAFDEDGYFLTGDVGYFDENGCLFVVDRIKDLIKYKGFQVPPAELEEILLNHPAVKEAVVIGIPDERAGELPTAFVVRQPDSNVSDKELIQYVADLVSVYKQLSGGVRFIKEIPKNAAGKNMKRILRENAITMVNNNC